MSPRDDRQWVQPHAIYSGGTDVVTASGVSVPNGAARVIPAQVAGLKKQRDSLIAYLLVKVEAGDFHAVQDAASDIREINAKLEVLG